MVAPDDLESLKAVDALSLERSGALQASRIDMLFGAEASRSALEGNLDGYSILHFAAHGFVDPESPQRSGLVLSPAEDANGYLTAGDVSDLQLDAELAVLSACETAVGAVRAGEGVQSLARAFMLAGARGVVASLWPVADSAAAETMESFYREMIGRGLSPASALRAAKLRLRRQDAIHSTANTLGVGGLRPEGMASDEKVEAGHPFLWAPFIYTGKSR